MLLSMLRNSLKDKSEYTMLSCDLGGGRELLFPSRTIAGLELGVCVYVRKDVCTFGGE